MQADLIHEDKNLTSEIIKSFETGMLLNKSYNWMCVASAVMQVMGWNVLLYITTKQHT